MKSVSRLYQDPRFRGSEVIAQRPLVRSDSFRSEGGQKGREYLAPVSRTIASQLFRRSAHRQIKCTLLEAKSGLAFMSILANDSGHPDGSRFISHAVLATTLGSQAHSGVHHAGNSETIALSL